MKEKKKKKVIRAIVKLFAVDTNVPIKKNIYNKRNCLHLDKSMIYIKRIKDT